mgnify:FL=1
MPIYDLGKVVGPQGPKGDKGDTGDAQDCTLVTDWDNAVTTGYYYSVNFDDLNHPPMGDSYYSGSVVAFEGYVRQTVCGLVTNKYMTRFKGGTGIWSAWEYVSPSDAKKITFESNTDILSTTVQSAIQEVYDKKVDAKAILITDWNDAVNPGVYFSSSSAANKPPSPLGDDWFGQVFVYNDRVKQILTHASSAPIGIERWVRSWWSSSQSWSEWSQSFKNATSTSNGLMSSTDKAKLDGIDAYTKSEIDSKFDTINTIMVPMLIKCYGIREAMHQFVSAYASGAEDLSPIVGRFFQVTASTIGETYTSQFYKYSAGTTTEGIKLDDNAGLTCTPSTIATAGTDDYANLPLFACFDCNYTIDADTLEPVIHAIKDVYGEFTSTPTDSFVGVLQMTGWVRRTSGETTKTVEYKAQKADGFEPLPEAVRALDNTVRSFVIHAKYAAGYNSAGLLSSVSGVQPATLRTGSAGSTSISHNGQIAKWREWGSQYCGSSLCDIAFVQLMLEIKYAVLGSAQVMQGCRTYSTDTYQAAVSETGVTRVLLTAANAAYFVVGSCVSLGSGNNRAAATCYDICDISKITSIEDVTVDDVAYKAVNLDTETTFNTTTDTYIIPQPWRTGSTDDVPGNDGSPYSNTSGKEPCKIQGIELMLGMYEVPADTTLYEDAEKYTVYANRKASEIALGGSGTNPITIGTIQKETDAGWKSIAELDWNANSQEAYMLAQEVGGSPTTGYRARVYLDAAATTGWREWPAFGGLTGGSSGGFACAGLYAGIGTVGWDIGARACGSGGNRGGFTSAYEEDMTT